MDSDFPPASPDGQRRSSGEAGAPSRAVVRLQDDMWTAEVDGIREHEGPSQVGAEIMAAEQLADRGGGQLLVRDALGRQVKRIIVGAGDH